MVLIKGKDKLEIDLQRLQRGSRVQECPINGVDPKYPRLHGTPIENTTLKTHNTPLRHIMFHALCNISIAALLSIS